MTISYPDTHTPPTVESGETYVPIYARKPPRKKATPWLMAAPVALAAAGAIGWVALSSDGETPAAPAETVELTALEGGAPLAATGTFTETAPLDPAPPAAAEPAPVEAAPAPVRRAAAPAPRRAAVQPATPAPVVEPAAAVAEEEAVPTGPQPYLAESGTAPVAPAATTPAEPEPILITPRPLD